MTPSMFYASGREKMHDMCVREPGRMECSEGRGEENKFLWPLNRSEFQSKSKRDLCARLTQFPIIDGLTDKDRNLRATLERKDSTP